MCDRTLSRFLYLLYPAPKRQTSFHERVTTKLYSDAPHQIPDRETARLAFHQKVVCGIGIAQTTTTITRDAHLCLSHPRPLDDLGFDVQQKSNWRCIPFPGCQVNRPSGPTVFDEGTPNLHGCVSVLASQLYLNLVRHGTSAALARDRRTRGYPPGLPRLTPSAASKW